MSKAQYPPWHLKNTPLYHMSHIRNLLSILEAGALCAKNYLECTHESIANKDIQEKRSEKQVVEPPYGSLHDYAPFYFAPRSPMLYQNKQGGLPNAQPQEEIIYFITEAELIHSHQLPYVFYDHPIKPFAACYNDIKNLNEIKWEIFYEKPLEGRYSRHWDNRHDDHHPLWSKRKELRQAEFLVHKRVDLLYMKGIGTMTENMRDDVLEKLSSFQVNIPVKIKREWYYT